MAHHLVDQLRFTRSEWLRGLRGPRRPEFVGDIDGKAPYRSSTTS